MTVQKYTFFVIADTFCIFFIYLLIRYMQGTFPN